MRMIATFIEGWRSLPDELKLHILHYVVNFDGTFAKRHFMNSHVPAPYKTHLHGIVYPMMSVPELKGLVVEAFYAQHTVLICRSTATPSRPDYMSLPPRAFRPHIRRMRFSSEATLETMDTIQFDTQSFGHQVSTRLASPGERRR